MPIEIIRASDSTAIRKKSVRSGRLRIIGPGARRTPLPYLQSHTRLRAGRQPKRLTGRLEKLTVYPAIFVLLYSRGNRHLHIREDYRPLKFDIPQASGLVVKQFSVNLQRESHVKGSRNHRKIMKPVISEIGERTQADAKLITPSCRCEYRRILGKRRSR